MSNVKRDTFPWTDGCTPEEHSMLEYTIELALNPEVLSDRQLKNPFKKIDTEKIAHYILDGKENKASRENVSLSSIQSEYSSSRKVSKSKSIDGRKLEKHGNSMKK